MFRGNTLHVPDFLHESDIKVETLPETAPQGNDTSSPQKQKSLAAGKYVSWNRNWPWYCPMQPAVPALTNLHLGELSGALFIDRYLRAERLR